MPACSRLIGGGVRGNAVGPADSNRNPVSSSEVFTPQNVKIYYFFSYSDLRRVATERRMHEQDLAQDVDTKTE